ncbi:MAG: ABC transporter permease, partial [Pseudomonadota bacterium]|nr:ABC transporter permease [Pseudomonadota bacterium]
MSRAARERTVRWLADYLPALAVFAAFVLLWQIAVSFLGVREYLLPSPGAVLRAMFSDEIPWL